MRARTTRVDQVSVGRHGTRRVSVAVWCASACILRSSLRYTQNARGARQFPTPHREKITRAPARAGRMRKQECTQNIHTEHNIALARFMRAPHTREPKQHSTM